MTRPQLTAEERMVVAWMRKQKLWTPEQGFKSPAGCADAITRLEHRTATDDTTDI